MSDDVLTRDEVAALLRIDPEYVRKLMTRKGIRAGYSRASVEALARTNWRAGQGRRTDLSPKTPSESENPDA